MRLLLSILFAAFAISMQAQTNRATTLQGARTLMVTDAKGKSDRYSVTASSSLLIRLKDGQLVFPDKSVNMADVKTMRLEIPQRFALSEDSTTFSPYNVDHGLLALRRSLMVGKWNSLVVPVSLAGHYLLDAFGEGTLLATYQDILETESEAQVNFISLNLDTDDIVLQPGVHYLICPTREPDIAAGAMTTVSYGAARVPGPAYLLEGATMTTSNKAPQTKSVRSDQDNVRLRFSGTYTLRDGQQKLPYVYALDAEGDMTMHTDSVVMKAFSSWATSTRNTNQVPMVFYVDGIRLTDDVTGIGNLTPSLSKGERTFYDLQGRSVAHPKRGGIYVVNGKKVYVR